MRGASVQVVNFRSIGKYKKRRLLENSFPMQQRRYDERSEEFSCRRKREILSPTVKALWSQRNSRRTARIGEMSSTVGGDQTRLCEVLLR